MAVKLMVYVPVTHADALREALGRAGADRIGNYSHCSFSVRGVGRFRPEAGSRPFLGEQGRVEEVEEERVEVSVEEPVLAEVVAAMRAAHPYEEIVFDLYKLLPVELDRR